MATVTKKELAYRIAEKTGQKKVVVKRIIQEFITEIIEELASGNRLEFREFGVFEIKTRAARRARNPRTGVRVDVPSKAVVHFKAGRAMKDQVQEALTRGLLESEEEGSPMAEAPGRAETSGREPRSAGSPPPPAPPVGVRHRPSDELNEEA